MKKRIFILAMAILSTSAFAASGDITLSGTVSETGTSATKDITLSGKSVKPVSIDSDINTVDFGTVMLGKTATTSVDLIVEGEDKFLVALTTNDIENVVVTGIENKVTLGTAASTVPMTLAYTPTDVSQTLAATLTVTATYTD